ncbi:MAG TPA: M56 family metallopeptidase [Thermoanaerobaculia bacterium]|nr:M56 family metallopeptidase [Thermoanaerobaculia bacterium]
MRELADFALLVIVRSGLVAGAALLAARMRVRHGVLVCALLACAIVPWVPSHRVVRASGASLVGGAPEARATPNIIAWLYLIALAHSAASLLLAWRASRKLRANTTDPSPAAIAALETCARAFGVTATLRCSPRVSVPMTVGSTILLPRELPEETLLPVIAHELAHVRRRDALLHTFLKIVTLPIAFHPLVRMLERRVAVAREIACDALVTSTLVEPRAYARTLLSIAERGIAPRYAMAFGDADALELRLLSLRNIGSSSRKWIGAAIVIALVAFGASQIPLHVFGRRPDLSGQWILDRAVSSGPYDAFTARIVQTPASVATWQTRVRRGRTLRVHFQVFTDGVTRNLRIAGMEGRGSARWSGSHLVSEFSTPQGHHEETHVWLDDPNTLVVQAADQKSKHVFRRSQ